jgi:hypothetical protein
VRFPDGTAARSLLHGEPGALVREEVALEYAGIVGAHTEDFGAAKLKRGRTLVKLDADFAKVIKRGDYKVFFTPEGDCRGLYVRSKSAASFEVRELNRAARRALPIASSGGARTSRDTAASPSSTRACHCPPPRRARRASRSRRRQSCAHSSAA